MATSFDCNKLFVCVGGGSLVLADRFAVETFPFSSLIESMYTDGGMYLDSGLCDPALMVDQFPSPVRLCDGSEV